MSVKYLTVEQIESLHKILIDEFGGILGVRDEDLLDSAVHRCQHSFDGKDVYPTLLNKAAALFESLCQNHPFIDGNKRIAFLATSVFLELNGKKLEFDVNESEAFILGVAAGEKSLEEIEVFLRTNLV